MTLAIVIPSIISTIVAFGAFPGSAAAAVNGLADAVQNWIASAARGLRDSMVRHDPPPSGNEAPPSRARLLIGSTLMTIAFTLLLPAEGYLLYVGLTGLLGLGFPEAATMMSESDGATGSHLATKGLLGAVDPMALIEIAVSASVITTLLVAATWAFDERHLWRPANERSRRALEGLARAASAAAMATVLAVGLHRGTASFETIAPDSKSDTVAVTAPAISNAGVDAYLGGEASSTVSETRDDSFLTHWMRPALVVLGTIASVLAPTLIVPIAFLAGPVALAGLLWSAALLVAAGVFVVIARLGGIANETTRRTILLMIDASASLLLPAVIASRTIHDRERAEQKAGLPFSGWKLALSSWVLLVETERLVRLRQSQNEEDERRSLSEDAERQASDPTAAQTDFYNVDDPDSGDGMPSRADRFETGDPSTERVFHAYA